MSKHRIHISELEGMGRFAALLKQLHAGEEIVIEDDSRPVAVVHSAEPVHRSISECIALAKEHEAEGDTPVLDTHFADDMQEILPQRRTLERVTTAGEDYDVLMKRLQHIRPGRRFSRDEMNQK